jgi:hypothetical protein
VRSLVVCLGVYVPLGILAILMVCGPRCPLVIAFGFVSVMVPIPAIGASLLLIPAFNSGLIESVPKQLIVFIVVAFVFQAALLFLTLLSFDL